MNASEDYEDRPYLYNFMQGSTLGTLAMRKAITEARGAARRAGASDYAVCIAGLQCGLSTIRTMRRIGASYANMHGAKREYRVTRRELNNYRVECWYGLND